MTKRILAYFFTLGFWILAPALSYSATYYVAPDIKPDGTSFNNSSSTNVGTSANPFTSLSTAVNILKPGDTLLLLSGRYNEQLSPTKAGTSSNWITIKAENEGEATIDGRFREIGGLL